MRISRTTTWNNRGFTLAELVIVVAVIALAVTLTLPLLGKTGNEDLRAAGRKLAGSIKYLYNEAVLEGASHRLRFDLDRAVYYVDRQDQSGEWHALPGRPKGNSLAGSVSIKEIRVRGREPATSGEVAIQIYPVGWIDETVLYLEDGKYQLTLLVPALTGATEFFEGHREL